MFFEHRAKDRSVGKTTLFGQSLLGMLAGISFGDHPNRFPYPILIHKIGKGRFKLLIDRTR